MVGHLDAQSVARLVVYLVGKSVVSSVVSTAEMKVEC